MVKTSKLLVLLLAASSTIAQTQITVGQVRAHRGHGDDDAVERVLRRARAVADDDLAAGGRRQSGRPERGDADETSALRDRHGREQPGGE